MLRFLLLIVILLLHANTSAAVYKWTDAEGRVHYSDKKTSTDARETSVDVKFMPDARYVESHVPEVYAGRDIDDWLSIAVPANKFTDGFPGDIKKRVHFYFGGDCVSPTSLSLSDLFLRYPLSIDKSYSLDREVKHTFKKYSYGIISSRLDDYSKYKGRIRHNLFVELVDIKINACAQRIPVGKQTGLLDDFHTNSFKKSNVWLRLKWTIVDKETKEIYVETYTEGAANKVNGRDKSMSGIYRSALARGAENLLAADVFLSYLDNNQIQPENKRVVVVPPAPSEKSLLSKVGDFFELSYIKASKLTQAYSLVVPLKTRFAEYYLINGTWPISFESLNLDSGSLHEPGLIRNVELYGGGVIHVLLDEQEFGVGHYFEITPRISDSMGNQNINWDCMTSLDEAYQMGGCLRR